MTTSELKRRGFSLGTISEDLPNGATQVNTHELSKAWRSGNAFKMSAISAQDIVVHKQALEGSHVLYHSILDADSLDDLLAEEPYESRLLTQFEAMGSSLNEGNSQEIETVFFDAPSANGISVEDLWIKASWLSFHEEDESLRFRFSFGVDFEEDVANDKLRQRYSADLTEAVFPESRIISKNQQLSELLKTVLETESIHFVERIVYFNAPNGGAYLHHDRERGHAGVVYAQLSGHTYWLTLPRVQLVNEVKKFIDGCIEGLRPWPSKLDAESQKELTYICKSEQRIKEELESFNNGNLIQLINETEEFVQTLIKCGYGQSMHPGDMLLLPQESEDLGCYHSVFCLDDKPGEALSFAIRPA